jgi:16S rRNA (cytosine967-C5)-methyltransferase
VTCSPHLAETNAIVDWAKKKLSGLELLDANGVLTGLNSNLQLNRSRKTAQLWPHIHQTDAMFIALLAKTSS